MKGKMAVVTHEVRGRARHSQEAMKKKSGEIVKSGGHSCLGTELPEKKCPDENLIRIG